MKIKESKKRIYSTPAIKHARQNASLIAGIIADLPATLKELETIANDERIFQDLEKIANEKRGLNA